MSKPVQGPQIDQLSSIHADGSRKTIHPGDVRGRWTNRRSAVFAVLIAIYVALPLVRVNGHPAVHLDIAARRFYLFGGTFNAQDFWIMVFLVTGLGFSLLFATAWLGRVWCGWACPQTVFLEGVYRRIERLIDGPRERRLKTAAGPWTAGRVGRAVLKHGAFLIISWLLAHVALALFLSVKDLANMMIHGPAGHEAAFTWAVVTTGLLYFNFAWFREQLCVIVCPYGRLQSAMTDRDSLIVGYDAARGEPRGRMVKGQAAGVKGDCVDCMRCVQVCPTGIDIRNGLQLECLACAQCVDACDEVMTKIGRPTGLIRYDSLNGLSKEKKRVLRPRLLAYGGFLAVAGIAATLALTLRTPFEANLLRFQGAPFVVDNGTIRNQYELHLVNKNPEEATFRIEVEGRDGMQVLVPQKEITLGSLESHRVPLFVTVDKASWTQPFHVKVEVEDQTSGQEKHMEARFLGPRTQGQP
ncbi:MAG: cytochrome c oxidase accessory protein CcoG [Myxococcaceae bacterium]